jgi:hypothetical protein
MRIRRLLPLFLLAACAGDPSGSEAGAVRVEVTPRLSTEGWEAEFEVRNESSRTVYVPLRCGPEIAPALERREGGAWVAAPYDLVCFARVVAPLEVRPGASVRGTVPIAAAGEYRLRVVIAIDRRRPLETTSPGFTVPPAD